MEPLESPGVGLKAETLLRLRYLACYGRAFAKRRVQRVPGAITVPRRGLGLEINDIRTWIEGDDVRHVDRNVTARTGVPHVRTFCDDRNRTTLLVADFRPSMLFGTKRAFRSVAAAEALALVGWRIIGQGSRLGLLTIAPGEPVFVPPLSGERAMRAVIGCLVDSHARALATGDVKDAPLDRALAIATRCLPRAAALIIATALDEPGESFASVVRSLAHRGDLSIILVSDAFERERPAGLYSFVTRAGGHGWARVERTRIASADDPHLSNLTDLGARTVRLDTELEPEAVLPILEGVIVA
jgi:uncharacterized protein (DUF58 family)